MRGGAFDSAFACGLTDCMTACIITFIVTLLLMFVIHIVLYFKFVQLAKSHKPAPPPVVTPVAPPPPPPPADKPFVCPQGYGVGPDNTCLIGWSKECGQACAEDRCRKAGGTWVPLDYRYNPYTCRMKPSTLPKTIVCPPGYGIGPDRTCLMGWSKECGQACAENRCRNSGGTWVPLDYRYNPYTCRPKES